MKQLLKDILPFCIVGLGVLGVLVVFVLAGEENNEQNIVRYEACIERTNDIEWCFNEFRPRLTDGDQQDIKEKVNKYLEDDK